MDKNQMKDFLEKNKLPPIEANGIIHRFDIGNHSGNGWGLGKTYNVGEKVIMSFKYGDWVTGKTWTFSTAQDLSEEEIQSLNDAMREEKELQLLQKKEMESAVSQEAIQEWETFSTVGESPYLNDKKISGLYGLRLKSDEHGVNLIAPITSITGDLRGYQKIAPNGGKYFKSGTPVHGSILTIPYGTQINSSQIFLCEGVATGLTLYEAIRKPITITFNAGNLKEACRLVREKYTNAEIIVCSDDDYETESTLGYNPGLDAAKYCATKYNAKIAKPQWKGKRKGTDFNDLHFYEGIEAVASSIEATLRVSTELAPIEPMDGRRAPTDRDVALTFLNFMETQGRGEDLVQDQGEIFKWKDTHWEMMEERDRSILRNSLQILHGGSASIEKLKSLEEMLIEQLRMQEAPKFFNRTPTKCNFLNGSLAFNNGAFELREHSRKDYLTHCLPYEIDVTAKYEPGEFTSWVRTLFDGDVEDNTNLVSEIFAAAMFPVYPKAFLIFGRPGTGKTTLTRILEKLIPEKFTAKVDPKDFTGYTLADMVGKIVNICNDISSGILPDDTVKKLLDGEPIQVRRIYKNPITAVLPKVHIFTANKAPITYETSGAYARRWILLHTPNAIAPENMVFNFADNMWNKNSKEIILFAMEGMKRLAQSGGKYTTPAHSKELMETWVNSTDLISNFLDALREGEVQGINTSTMSCDTIGVGEDLIINRTSLYDAFERFAKGQKLPSRNRFFDRISEVYTPYRHRKEGRFFKGIGFQLKKGEVC